MMATSVPPPPPHPRAEVPHNKSHSYQILEQKHPHSSRAALTSAHDETNPSVIHCAEHPHHLPDSNAATAPESNSVAQPEAMIHNKTMKSQTTQHPVVRRITNWRRALPTSACLSDGTIAGLHTDGTSVSAPAADKTTVPPEGMIPETADSGTDIENNKNTMTAPNYTSFLDTQGHSTVDGPAGSTKPPLPPFANNRKKGIAAGIRSAIGGDRIQKTPPNQKTYPLFMSPSGMILIRTVSLHCSRF